jgi:ribosomal protein L29
MKFSDLQELSKDGLHTLHGKNLGRLSHLRFQIAANQLKNVREVRVLRKTNARILTMLKMK